MKKTIVTTLAILMLGGFTAAAATPADAASYGMHPSYGVHLTVKSKHHSKHWNQHLWCKTTWHHHRKHTVCIWVPNHR